MNYVDTMCSACCQQWAREIGVGTGLQGPWPKEAAPCFVSGHNTIFLTLLYILFASYLNVLCRHSRQARVHVVSFPLAYRPHLPLSACPLPCLVRADHE